MTLITKQTNNDNRVEITKDGKYILHGVFQTFNRNIGRIYDRDVYLIHLIDLEKR